MGTRGGDRSTFQKVTIDLRLPLDGSLTRLLIYEGVLYTLRAASWHPEPPYQRYTLDKNDLMKLLREDLEEARLNSLNIATVGKNDSQSIERLFDSLGVGTKEKKITRFGDILRLIKETRNLKISNEIVISTSMKGKKLFIGGKTKEEEGKGEKKGKRKRERDDEKAERGITFQIFKTERYTGFTSTEHPYTAEQITAYMSPEVALLALLGLYSSFVVTVENIHYMLFFAPEEAGNMLSGEKDIMTMFLIKDDCRETLAEIIRRKYSEELIIVESLLNAKIQSLLSRHNVKSIMLTLLKLAREGQTYKIYQYLPLALYQRAAPELWQGLSKILDPQGVILSRLAKSDNVEHSHLVSMILGIYRYVVLGDRWGLYAALRELYDAYRKIGSDERAKDATQRYLRLLQSLPNLAERM